MHVFKRKPSATTGGFRLQIKLNTYMNVSTALERFLDAQAHLTEPSLATYRRECEKLVKFIDGSVTEITRSSIGEYTKWLIEHHNDGGVRHNLRCVKVFLRFAREEGWTDLNTSAIKTPRRPHPVKEILEEWEMLAIIDEMTTTRDKLIVAILWDTGIRVQELVDIKVEDLLTNQGINIVRRKSYRRATVYYSELTEKYLLKHLSKHKHEYLFISRRGNKLNSRDVQRLIKIRSWFLDKNITPHSFRHTMAWRILEGGGELIDVQNALGHTDPLTTQRSYMNWYEDKQRQRINRSLNRRQSAKIEEYGLPRKERKKPTATQSIRKQQLIS